MNYAIKRDGRGKITVVEGMSQAMLKLWALQNTKGKAVTYVCDEDYKVVLMIEGRGQDFPKIADTFEEDMYIELGA